MRSAYLFVGAILVACGVFACSSDNNSGTTTTDTGVATDTGAKTDTSSDTGSDTASSGPTVKITSPATGTTLAVSDLTDGSDYDIGFAVTNFTTKDPGSCAGVTPPCGHVHLLINGTTCNDTANGFPYNAAAGASPVTAGFDYCPGTIGGAYTLVVELHNDDHTLFKDANGHSFSDSIMLTITGGSDAGPDGATSD